MKALLASLTGVLLLSSCEIRDRVAGPPISETKRADLGKAEMLEAEIRMGAGELRVEGGEQKAVSARFDYNQGRKAPSFRLDDSSFRARLVIEQGEDSVQFGGSQRNSWEVKLPETLATDLEIKMGAGEARLKLGTVDLRSVKLGIGAGKVVADFRGMPKRDYEIEINGGVGDCEVGLPKGVGLHAEAHGGIGAIEVSGLEKHGDSWENEAFSKPGVKVRLRARGGIGRIVVRAE